MKSRFLVTLGMTAVLAAAPLRATTVTGTMKDSHGNPLAGATVRFELMNCGAGGVCTLTGGGGIVSPLPIETVTSADGSFSIQVNGNDAITPAGTFYEVRTIAAGGTVYSANYAVTGSSFNLNNAAPLGAMPPAPVAAAYTTVANGGVTIQKRQTLNFVNGGCSDNPATSSTDCTVTGGGGGATLQTNGSNNADQTTLNLQSGSPANGLTLTETNTGGGNVQLGLSGTLTVPGGGTGLASLVSHSLYVGNGSSSPSAVAAGNAGQVLVSNGAAADPSFQDPVVSYNFANLLNAAAATSGQTSAPARVSTLSGFGTLYVTYAGIAGAPSGCTLQLKNADSLGNLVSNGAAISTTPANGTTANAVLSGSGLQTTAQMEVLYACAAYPSAGTISVDYIPGLAAGIVNTPSVSQSGPWTVQQGSPPWTVSESGSWTVTAQVQAFNGSSWVNAAPMPADASTWTQVSSIFDPIGCFYNSSITNLTSGQAGGIQCTNTRHAMVNVADPIPAGSNTIGAVTQASGPWTANVTQINGSTLSTAATGVEKVGVVGNAGAAFDGATAAAPPANAIQIGGLVSGATGGQLGAFPVCDSYDVVSISTATTTLEITGVSGRQVRICSLHLVTAAANNVAIIEGTGATCGTGSAGMAGGTTAASGYNFAANGGMTLGNGVGTVMRTATVGDSVCIVTSAATQLSGGISYAIY